jgi:hypothetical protein
MGVAETNNNLFFRYWHAVKPRGKKAKFFSLLFIGNKDEVSNASFFVFRTPRQAGKSFGTFF